ncbi:hypothetical protein [Streptomyces sp. NBC_01262]|uniref:hypothetical protein n=1 Tax=Streptomyces sp. NBC_01262 TaxID=2903803 RepID=UPI002E37DBC9|nr:hypothetical protein [Streptomyces sp. NBC_01262]
MSRESFGRAWDYRFYDARGLITSDQYPDGINGTLDSNELAWRAAEVFQKDVGITVTRIERQNKAGDWEAVPVL